jgi:mannose-1-phosphate guanylyltransferase
MKIVIRAGGVGTRLWPCSTSRMPKQFLPLFGDRSCAQTAYERFVGSGLVRPEDVYVSVGRDHEAIVREQFAVLPADHVIVEPSRQDTGAAIGLESVWIAREAPEATIASLGSDHWVARPEVFIAALRAAEAFLSEKPEYLVAIACEPTRAETNYGHVKKGAVLGRHGGVPVHQAEEFTEKPDAETAERMTASGEYLWNANFFVWRAETILDFFRRYKPAMYETLKEIQVALGTDGEAAALERLYPQLEKVAIDYAVMEPAGREGRIATIPADMGWSDIGSWATLTDAFPPDEGGNLFVGGEVFSLGTRDTTVYIDNPARRLVAVLDVEGLAIVETAEALLVVPKEKAGRVKELVGELKKREATRDLV